MDNEQFHESSASVHYRPFADQLNHFILSDSPCIYGAAHAAGYIDAEANFAVERLVPYALRSELGIFFTPEEISLRCASLCQDQIQRGESFFDPACGSGNLLVGIARQYEIKSSLSETVAFWGEKFGGCDINESFVRVAKLRLIALAAFRHGISLISKEELGTLLCFFLNFHVRDYLISPVGGAFDCVIANPPFAHRMASNKLGWSAGKTQLAAIFVDAIIKNAKPNQKVLAILPDVLRSGTRYKGWREFVDAHSKESVVHVYGRFSPSVDVDVFVLDIAVSTQLLEPVKTIWVESKGRKGSSKSIEDLFTVNIGPVVPHRLKDAAGLVPFICAKSAPAYEKVVPVAEIKFDGTLYCPPFVVLRRTSNPSDKQRLISSVVVGVEPVAVENHLIVVRPRNESVDTCSKLVDFLRGKSATQQVNAMIRCRHLTKGVISSIVLPRGFK